MKENIWRRSRLWAALFAEKMDMRERQQKFITSVLEAEWRKEQVTSKLYHSARSTTGREGMARLDSIKRQSHLRPDTEARKNYWVGWGSCSLKMPKSVCLVDLKGVV